MRAQDDDIKHLRSTNDLFNTFLKCVCDQKDKTIEYQQRELEKSSNAAEQLRFENKKLLYELHAQEVEIKRLLLDDASDFGWKVVADGKSQVIKDQEQQIETIKCKNNAAVKELEIKHESLQKDHEKLAQSHKLLQQKHQSLQQDHASLRQDHETLRGKKTKSDKKIQDLEARLTSRTQDLLKAKEELASHLKKQKPSQNTSPWLRHDHTSDSASPAIQIAKNTPIGATVPSKWESQQTTIPRSQDPLIFASQPHPWLPRGLYSQGGAQGVPSAVTQHRRAVDDVLALVDNRNDLPPIVTTFLQTQFSRTSDSLCRVDAIRFRESVLDFASDKICVQQKASTAQAVVPGHQGGACNFCIDLKRVCLQREGYHSMKAVPLPAHLRSGNSMDELGYWVQDD